MAGITGLSPINRYWDRILWKGRRVTLARGRPKSDRGPSSPVIVAGLYSTASGVGETARSCARALQDRGVEVLRCDLSALFGQAESTFRPSRTLSHPGQQCGTIILHVNAPETELALFGMRAWRLQNWRIIGYWAWELERLPDGWASAARYLSEIWTPSRFSAAAIQASVDVPVHTVPPAIQPPDPLPVRCRQLTEFEGLTCLVMADGRSSLERKNVIAAIRLFDRAFGARTDVRLVVKTRNLDADPRKARVIRKLCHAPNKLLIDEALSNDEKWALLNSADILLSLHRSEGFGLSLAEAMALGKAVIATRWSGNLDFMTRANSVLVPARFIPVADPSGPYDGVLDARWAAPDLDSALKALKWVAASPEARQEIGNVARATIRQRYDGGDFFNALTGPSRRARASDTGQV